MVHHAGQAVLSHRLRPPGARGRAAAVCALTLALAGCGGDDGGGGAKDSGALSASPVSARSANCQNWQNSTAAQRRLIVADVRKFAGGPVGAPGGRGNVISDTRAQRVFDSFCKRRFARAFKLYKLYTRAAAFSNQPAPGQ